MNGTTPPPQPPATEDLLLIDDALLTQELRALANVQLGYLSTRQLDARGVGRSIIRQRVRAGLWRRPTRGVVDLAVDPPDTYGVGLRRLRAAVLALVAFGPDAIAVGLTALALRGVWGVPPKRSPEIAMPHADKRRSRDGLTCRRFERGVRVETVRGMKTVPIVVALAQGVCEVSPRTALGLLDSALHLALLEPDEIEDVRRATRGRRWCRRLFHVWALVDPRRESPPESHAWYEFWCVNLVPTDIQISIYADDGVTLVARPDIGFELEDGSWLFFEVDGEDAHPEGNRRDRIRDAGLLRLLERRGIRADVVRFRPRDHPEEGAAVETLRKALGGRRLRRRHPNATAALNPRRR